MKRLMRFLACGAFVGGVACGEINPKDALSVVSCEPSNRIGGVQRIRYTLRSAERQYPIGNIVVKMEWMRRGREGPPYAVQTSQFQARMVKPYGVVSNECEVIAPPPCREGETEAGFVVTPISAIYLVVPRSL